MPCYIIINDHVFNNISSFITDTHTRTHITNADKDELYLGLSFFYLNAFSFFLRKIKAEYKLTNAKYPELDNFLKY